MSEGKLSSQERMLVIVEKLTDRAMEGMSNKQLAFELKTSEANMCRDLSILEKRGWIARSAKTGNWRLTPLFGGFAGAIVKCFQSAKLDLMKDEAMYLGAMQ